MSRVSTFGPSPDTLTPSEVNNLQDDYNAFGTHQWTLQDFGGVGAATGAFAAGRDFLTTISSGGSVYISEILFAFDPLHYEDPANATRKIRVGLKVAQWLASNAAVLYNATWDVQRVSGFAGSGAMTGVLSNPTTPLSVSFVSSTDLQGAVKSASVDASGWLAGVYLARVTLTTGSGAQQPVYAGKVYALSS